MWDLFHTAYIISRWLFWLQYSHCCLAERKYTCEFLQNVRALNQKLYGEIRGYYKPVLRHSLFKYVIFRGNINREYKRVNFLTPCEKMQAGLDVRFTVSLDCCIVNLTEWRWCKHSAIKYLILFSNVQQHCAIEISAHGTTVMPRVSHIVGSPVVFFYFIFYY